MDEPDRPLNDPHLQDAATPSNQLSVAHGTDHAALRTTSTAGLSEPIDAVKKRIHTPAQAHGAREALSGLPGHGYDASEVEVFSSGMKNRMLARQAKLSESLSVGTPEPRTSLDRPNRALAFGRSNFSNPKARIDQLEHRLVELRSESDAKLASLQQRVISAEQLIETMRAETPHQSSGAAAQWAAQRYVLRKRAADAEQLLETERAQAQRRYFEAAAQWTVERDALQKRATEAEQLIATMRNALQGYDEAAERQLRVLQERPSLMQQRAGQAKEFERPAPPTGRPQAHARTHDDASEEDPKFLVPLPDADFYTGDETQSSEPNALHQQRGTDAIAIGLAAERQIKPPNAGPPKRKGGRLASRKQKIAKIEPLAIVVRDRSGDGWTSPENLSPEALDALNTQNKQLAHKKSSFEGYTKMVRKRALSVNWCVQCDLVSHARAGCGLNGANTACGRCVRSKRACSKFIEHEGELKMAWLPLEEELRDENVSWAELPYWQVPEE